MVEALLRNTIETYPSEWRLIHEPLQNAIDSFIDEKTGRAIADLPKTPKVTLELKLGSNLVKIWDNGRGVPLSHFSDFLILGGGTKGLPVASPAKRVLKGSQGVGIKSTVFTSSYFHIKTVNAGQLWEKDLPGFASYANPGFNEEVEEPEAKPTKEPSGTEIVARLENYSVWDFVKERASEFFQTVGIDNTKVDADGRITLDDNPDRKVGPFAIERILMRYFKKDSYAGCVSRSIGAPNLPAVEFELALDYDFPPDKQAVFAIPGIEPMIAGKYSSASDHVGYLDFNSLIKKLPAKQQPAVVSDYRQVLQVGQKFDRPTVFYQLLSRNDIAALLGRLRRRRSGDPPGSTEYVLVEDREAIDRNQTALERTNGAVLFISSRPFQRNVLGHKSSISLSVNGLPTDISLEVTGAALGYIPSTHFILDVDETLGYGKRNLPPRSKGLYNQLAKDLWRNLQKLAGSVVAEQEERDWTLTGILFKPKEEAALILDPGSPEGRVLLDKLGRLSIPRTEEDVVATYFFMAGKGLLPRFRFVRLNDVTVYDGLSGAPDSEEVPRPEQLLTVEFKFSTQQLCQSDEQGRQRIQDLQLVIVWESTDQADLPPGYTIVPREADIGYSDYFDGPNYRLKGGRHSVQVIALKDVFQSLVNPPPPPNAAAGLP